MTSPRGFTLLIAIILATIAVTLGVSLLDLSYKQTILTSTAKQSQYGFYAADSAIECGLYWDQKFNSFKIGNTTSSASIECAGRSISSYTKTSGTTGGVSYLKTEFLVNVGCTQSAQTNGKVTIYKYADGRTSIYGNGFSSCTANDPRRVERGLKVFY